MNILDINTSNIDTAFLSLETKCNGQLKNSNNTSEFIFDNVFGDGVISGFNFNKNITYFTFDLTFNEDTKLVFSNSDKDQSLNYCYCTNGEIRHSFNENGKIIRFSEMQTGVFSNSVGKNNHFHFQKNQRQKFTLISFLANKPISESTDDFTGQLMQLFQAQEANGQFAYASSHNLKLQQKFNQIEALSGDNIATTLLKKGILQVSMGMIVNQYFEDLEAQTNRSFALSQNEMESIKEISDFIKNYPDQQFDLNFLSEKTGLTPAKLQEGFKALFGRTVSNFIKNVRVELAEQLIKTTDLNISQIVYTIGLSSRSYFSKIFKEKYNCSPKQYQEGKVNLKLSA